jgi:hypothetical protein
MTSRILRSLAAAALALAGGMFVSTRPALAQGPYGRNSYADFPYNQGSLFYRPLKPAPRPKPKVVRPAVPATPAPVTGGYFSTPRQPYVAPRQQSYYYYYPAYPR